jgi:hypothetical protein
MKKWKSKAAKVSQGENKMKKMKITEDQKKEIIRLYDKTDETTTNITKEFKICENSLIKIMRDNNIILRKDRPAHLPCLNEKQMEILNGSMLGDSTISNDFGNSVFSKDQCEKKLEYVQWMFNELKPYSSSILKKTNKALIHCSKTKKITKNNNKFLKSFQCRSIRHPIFTKLSKKWYLTDEDGNFIKDEKGWRIKIVPSDLVLTPLTIAVWAADDGCNSNKKHDFRLYTNGFTKKEVEFLSCQLKNKFNVFNNIYKGNGYFIAILARSYADFIELIKPYFVWDCFKYKIDYKPFKPYKIWDFPGIRSTKSNKWQVEIKIKNKKYYLGTFNTQEEAIKVKQEFILTESNK